MARLAILRSSDILWEGNVLLHLASTVGLWIEKEEFWKVRVESFVIVFVVETLTHERALFLEGAVKEGS